MGSLIPNPHDQNVSHELDNTFSDPHLRNLRNRIHGHGAAEPHFFSDPGNARHLARISHRLKIHPNGPPPPTPAQLKARWQYFLQTLLTDPVTAAQNGTTVAEVIRKALQVFVVTDDPKCTAITFDAIPNDGSLPNGINYRAHINPDPDLPRGAEAYIATIKLMCRTEIAAGVNAPDPNPDNGEVPPVQPNI
jgi:hypothetical protein